MPDKNTSQALRIVHVITRLINGGADENTVISCNYAAASGHDVFLVHGADTRPEILAKVDQRVELVKVPTLVRPLAPVRDIRAFRLLLKTFRNLKPDIVHTHTSKAGILGRFAARLSKVPCIVHGVHIAPFVNVGIIQRSIYKIAEKAVAHITDAYISVSQGMRDAYLDAGIGDPHKHHVIASGFDLDAFRNAGYPEDWRELLGLTPEASRPPVLLMMAAFEPRKRHLEFLNVFQGVAEQFPDVRLVLAGDGNLREVIASEIARLGLERNVKISGFRKDPHRLIALADICVLTSLREGLPRVVMQYLAGGKPCIATNLPGLEEVLHQGINGIVVPSEDINAVADAVIELLENPKEHERLAWGAANTDLSNWDADLMCERIEAVYQRIIGESSIKYRNPAQQVNSP